MIKVILRTNLNQNTIIRITNFINLCLKNYVYNFIFTFSIWIILSDETDIISSLIRKTNL